MIFVKSSTLVFNKTFSSSKLVEGFGTWFSFSLVKREISSFKTTFSFSKDSIFKTFSLIKFSFSFFKSSFSFKNFLFSIFNLSFFFSSFKILLCKLKIPSLSSS
ncbi:hypothetical protein U1Q18_052495 [Sarracenia purpurea var. burkii]